MSGFERPIPTRASFISGGIPGCIADGTAGSSIADREAVRQAEATRISEPSMPRDYTVPPQREAARACASSAQVAVGPSRRIVFGSHDLSNAETYHRWFNDRELHHYNCDRRFVPTTLSETIEALKRSWIRSSADCERYAVYTAGDRRLIGQADIYDISPDNRRARVGLEIGEKEFWGRGLGREILDEILEGAFLRLGQHRAEAVIYAFNERSLRLFQRAGFVREGCLRERLDRDGVFHDEYLLGLIDSEWRNHRGTL